MEILKAKYDDLQIILELQFLAYQSEAELLNNYEIPPLKQTISEIQNEYANGVILKAVENSDRIIGSVRAFRKFDTVHIGKLIVHPKHQQKGIGTALLREIETICPSARYELFTSDKSHNNLRLYEKLGYQRFKEQEITPMRPFQILCKPTSKRCRIRASLGGFVLWQRGESPLKEENKEKSYWKCCKTLESTM